MFGIIPLAAVTNGENYESLIILSLMREWGHLPLSHFKKWKFRPYLGMITGFDMNYVNISC